MGKRARTNYSHVVGIDKPAGMTSHDVVNCVRRIYGEKRVGHTGTLDPAATGVLMVCVGPAARLDRFLTGHDKTYEFSVVFGTATDTDDAEGTICETRAVPASFFDEDVAREHVAALIGHHQQLPPAYSAVRVEGKKAYALARAGRQIDFKPREIDVFDAELLRIEARDDVPIWHLRTHVSSGTYVRSLARDLGVALGNVAHVGSLRRVALGNIAVDECVSLEMLEEHPFEYLLDPVQLLEIPVLFAREGAAADVENGKALCADDHVLFTSTFRDADHTLCACTSGVRDYTEPLHNGDAVSVVVDNRLKAIYAYDEASGLLRSACGFSIGVQRGGDL